MPTTIDTITRLELKGMINAGKWKELGAIFSFTPVFLLGDTNKSFIIDWRCVPDSLCEILRRKGTTFKPRVVRVKTPSTARKLEHYGDAIVNLAARVLSDRIAEPATYFLCANHLASNDNLKTAGYVSGAQAEVEIGTVFAARGIVAALDHAMLILKRTKHYFIYQRPTPVEVQS